MNIKQRALELLQDESLRGRVPSEVQEFLRDAASAVPVAPSFDREHAADIVSRLVNGHTSAWIAGEKVSAAVAAHSRQYCKQAMVEAANMLEQLISAPPAVPFAPIPQQPAAEGAGREAVGVVDGPDRGGSISQTATLLRPLSSGTKLYTRPAPAADAGGVTDAIESILGRLDGWSKAYPTDIFPEPSAEDRKWLHETRPGLMDRIAASMGRHMHNMIGKDLATITAALALAQCAPQHGAVPKYTIEMGEAAERYHASFRTGHPLPKNWRWQHLWSTMLAAAPAPEAAKCACGLSTCVEPWEPGCGLGNSEEFVVAAPEAERAKGEAVYQYQTVTNGWHDLRDETDAERYEKGGWPVRKLYTYPAPPPAGQPEGVEATFGAFYTCPTCHGVGVTTKAVHDELRRLASAQRVIVDRDERGLIEKVYVVNGGSKELLATNPEYVVDNRAPTDCLRDAERYRELRKEYVDSYLANGKLEILDSALDSLIAQRAEGDNTK